MIETFLVRRQRRDNGDRSRLFLPPHYSTGEAGLRIHFESHGKKPALEVSLKTLRSAHEGEQVEWILERLARLVDYVPSPDFPSAPLETIPPRWESGFRELVPRYDAARRTCAMTIAVPDIDTIKVERGRPDPDRTT